MVSKLIEMYKKGMIVEHELLWRLADYKLAENEKLPEEWQEKVNELLAYRAANSDKVFRTFSIIA